MKNLPYFRWFPADAGMDETYAAMTYEERGFYHSLLNFSWINAGLPVDLEQLRRVMQVPPQDFDRLWARVFRRFEERDGRLVDPRQEAERDHATSKSRQASEAAVRRHSPGSGRSASAEDPQSGRTARAYDSDSASGVVSSGGMQGGWKADAEYARFVVDYLSTGAALLDEDFAAAHPVWRHLDFEQKRGAYIALRKRIEASSWDDPRYIPRPEKFLKSEWRRPIVSAKSKQERQADAWKTA